MRVNGILCAVAGLAMFCVSAGLQAQYGSGNRIAPEDLSKFGAAPTGPQAMQDRIFMRNAAEEGLGEISLGQLATQKSSDPNVKQFASVMVKDYTLLNANIKPLADVRDATTPKKMGKADQAEYNKLNGLSGADFDKEYMAYMVKNHQKAVQEFSDEAARTTDDALRPIVQNGQQAISNHLASAQKLAAANGAAS